MHDVSPDVHDRRPHQRRRLHLHRDRHQCRRPGSASTASAAVTPRTVPTAPSTVTATRGTAQAHVSWAAPLSNGGSAITAYSVTSSPGGKTCTSAGLSCWVTGLTNGTPYTFTVRAPNAGTGSSSTASAAVTPSAVVVRPTATVTPLSLYRPTTAVSVSGARHPARLRSPLRRPLSRCAVERRIRRLDQRVDRHVDDDRDTRRAIPATPTASSSSPTRPMEGHPRRPPRPARSSARRPLIDPVRHLVDRDGHAYYKSTFSGLLPPGQAHEDGRRRQTDRDRRHDLLDLRLGPRLLGRDPPQDDQPALGDDRQRKVIAVTTFLSARTGTLSLRVYGSGHRVSSTGSRSREASGRRDVRRWRCQRAPTSSLGLLAWLRRNSKVTRSRYGVGPARKHASAGRNQCGASTHHFAWISVENRRCEHLESRERREARERGSHQHAVDASRLGGLGHWRDRPCCDAETRKGGTRCVVSLPASR